MANIRAPLKSKTMSDTPRTDAAQSGLENAHTPMSLEDWKASFEWMCGHARSLERELAKGA